MPSVSTVSRRCVPGQQPPALHMPGPASAAAPGDASHISAPKGAYQPHDRVRVALRRAGQIGFAFFLAKGLVYLAASYVFFLMATDH